MAACSTLRARTITESTWDCSSEIQRQLHKPDAIDVSLMYETAYSSKQARNGRQYTNNSYVSKSFYMLGL